MKKISVLLLTSLFSASFAMAQPPKVPADKGTNFGEKVSAENVLSVEQLYKTMKEKKTADNSLEVNFTAVVTDVCEKEGCWIKVQSPNGKMMVRMKDHAFLVPMALNGKTVIISGIAEEKVISVEQLKHYAEDAGKSKAEIDAIKEPSTQIVVQAKGILVV